MNSNSFKHVCFKDLENYFRRDEYFSGLTKEELAEIRINLGISADNSAQQQYVGKYDYIKDLADKDKLVVGSIYIMLDFQTIYKIEDEVMGVQGSRLPSKKGTLILTAITRNKFNPSAILIYGEEGFDVKYDITPVKYNNITTQGTIYYMEDKNNNSAPYDFKNVRFKRTAEELKNSSTFYAYTLYFYTFDNGKGLDNSSNVRNNKLGRGANNIVFLKDAENNSFEADCHDITFLDDARNNTLYFGSMNTIFTNIVQYIRGTVKNRIIKNVTESSYVKEFFNSSDSLICVYYDPTTQTFLTELL